MNRAVNLCVVGLGFAAIAAFGISSFSNAEAQENRSASVRISNTQSAASPPTGEQLFYAKCAACHEAGGWGTRALSRRVPADQALLAKRANLPAAYVEMVVRHGVGSMPPFTATDLSEAELKRLAKWLEDKK